MRPSRLVNRRTIAIEWGDCDPAGIVFYPRYFAFFDACTAHLFEAAGLPKRRMLEIYGIVGVPMVDTRATFRIPSAFGDDITVESRIASWGRSSFKVEHTILKDEAIAVEGFETRVWVGREPGVPGGIKAQPIPEEVIALFA